MAGCGEGGEGKEVSRLGLNAARGCTDVLFLFLFFVCSVAYAVLATIAIDNGNPLRLLYGTDYLGNICGQSGERNSPREPFPENLNGSWAEYDVLWFPFDLDHPSEWRHAIDLGVCVKECPEKGGTVATYGNPGNYSHNIPESYPVTFSSTKKLRRCMPDDGDLGEKAGQLADLVDVSDAVYSGVAEVRSAQDVVYYSTAVAVGIALVWLILVYFFALPMVFITCAAVLAGFAVGGYLLHQHSQDMADHSKWVLAAAYVVWILGGLFLLVCLAMFKSLLRGAAVSREGSEMMLTMPSILIFPLLTTALLLGAIALGVTLVLYIQTMKSDRIESFAWAGSDVASAVEYIPYDRTYFHLYAVFFFLWLIGFVADMGFLCISLTTATWYFSSPMGDSDRHVPWCTTMHAMGACVRYHMGTAAFGSLIIAILQTIRWVILKVQSKLEDLTGEESFCLCCVHCCVWYVEKVLKIVSEKAYIMTAISGKSFCPAARRSMGLIVSNFASVAVIEVITGFMIFLGKLLVVVGTVTFAYFAIERWGMADEGTSIWAPLVVVGIIAYIIAKAFIHVFGVVVDTIIICHCLDKELHEAPQYGRGVPPKMLERIPRHDEQKMQPCRMT